MTKQTARPVWVAVYDSGAEDAFVIAVSTDRAKLDAAVEAWKADTAGAFDPDYIHISELDLIE